MIDRSRGSARDIGCDGHGGRSHAVQHTGGFIQQTDGFRDGTNGQPTNAHLVLDTLGEALEEADRGSGAFGVFRFEEFDVIEHLIQALVGQGVEFSLDAVANVRIHRLSCASARG